MNTYSFIPGPTNVPKEILDLATVNYGSADIEPEFLDLYNSTVNNLKQLYGTSNDVVVMSGEGMLVLWAGLKSCLQKCDKVLCLSTGLFGDGMKDMALSIGCEVKLISFSYNSTFEDYDLIEQTIKEFKPTMITAVQCETPSGVMNDISVIGQLKQKYNVPLLYVDSVSALGGAPVDVDKNHIDICLGGAQKALSAPPNSCFTTVSPVAWDFIKKVRYAGYDALLDFANVTSAGYFPYTPSWVNLAQLNLATSKILDEGLENVFHRHQKCAEMTRNILKSKGYKLYPLDESFSASTVTAAYVPDDYPWDEFNKMLRSKGVVCGGNYGALAGKVFRIGHMGSQADFENINALCGLL